LNGFYISKVYSSKSRIQYEKKHERRQIDISCKIPEKRYRKLFRPGGKQIEEDLSELGSRRGPLFYMTSRPALATAMALTVIVLLLTIPMLMKPAGTDGSLPVRLADQKGDEIVQSVSVSGAIEIQARKIDSSIILSWSGSEGKVYKVMRSSSPKDFSNAYTEIVAGNHWADPLPNNAHLVFYKIE